MRFDGVDDYVSVPNSTDFSASSITVSAWISPRTLSPDDTLAWWSAMQPTFCKSIPKVNLSLCYLV